MSLPFVRRAGGAARALCLLTLPLSALACASHPPMADASRPSPADRGYRALFRAESEGPGGKQRFRLAVALVPPDRLRLEFFGPVGGPRLVVASDGSQVTAMLPTERAYDSAPATSGNLDALIGVPLDGARLIALLTGRPMCPPESMRQEVHSKSAVTFGRTINWYEVSCPPDDIRYQAKCEDRGGILRQATVREGITGAMILEVEYDDHEAGLGPRWPRRIRVRMARTGSTVGLNAIDGPAPGEIPDAVFSPPVPEGFERRAMASLLSAPGLVGSTADKER
ncbi:MAG TPA: hypothetical protein VFT43_12870 [Candidatus Polarisedimenticolia bacterium]|nr:hypothetical protein [Candidatus Polarisedimenticolia bacterium]